MRNYKVFDEQIGFEIKGQNFPKFKRKSLTGNQGDLNIDIPNGDINLGRQFYKINCQPCHQLDISTAMGPSLRGIYLRKYGKSQFAKQECFNFTWNRNKLWEFLQDPEKMFPDTTMQQDGIKDPFTRASVIDYLQYLRVFTIDNVKQSII